jgi:hypothetical protein
MTLTLYDTEHERQIFGITSTAAEIEAIILWSRPMEGQYESDTITVGEFEAARLVYGEGPGFGNPHKAGDEIIALAEQIKAEREAVRNSPLTGEATSS